MGQRCSVWSTRDFRIPVIAPFGDQTMVNARVQLRSDVVDETAPAASRLDILTLVAAWPPASPPRGGPGPPTGAIDFEARVGDVITKLKPDVIGKFAYGSGSKPIDFEDWMRMTRFSLAAKHSQLVRWWDAICANARLAYESYLSLSPLQRSTVRPTNVDEFDGATQHCEHYMVAHVLSAMPQHISRMLLHTRPPTAATSSSTR